MAAQYERVIDFLRDSFPSGRSDAHRRRAGPDGVRRLPQGALAEDLVLLTPSSGLGRETRRRADVVQVFPNRESARPLIGSVLPEQRGVAVRRTPLPLPDLTATPDQHTPHRQHRQQHRRRRQARRPTHHHHHLSEKHHTKRLDRQTPSNRLNHPHPPTLPTPCFRSQREVSSMPMIPHRIGPSSYRLLEMT